MAWGDGSLVSEYIVQAVRIGGCVLDFAGGQLLMMLEADRIGGSIGVELNLQAALLPIWLLDAYVSN